MNVPSLRFPLVVLGTISGGSFLTYLTDSRRAVRHHVLEGLRRTSA